MHKKVVGQSLAVLIFPMEPCMYNMLENLFLLLCAQGSVKVTYMNCQRVSHNAKYIHGKKSLVWPLLLTWFNFNPSMDK